MFAVKVYIDCANPSFIKSLKLQIGEEADYDQVIARYKAEGFGDDATKDMIIAPVNFNKEHKAMLGESSLKHYELLRSRSTEISPAVEQVTGNKPITFSQFARDYAEAFK